MSHSTKHETLAEDISNLMSDGKDWTISTIAGALGVSNERVKTGLRRLMDAYRIYHSGRVEPSHANAYRLVGAGDSSPWLQTIDRVRERDANEQSTIDQRYRRQAPSWPVVDDVLVTAMYAMIKVTHSKSTDC